MPTLAATQGTLRGRTASRDGLCGPREDLRLNRADEHAGSTSHFKNFGGVSAVNLATLQVPNQGELIGDKQEVGLSYSTCLDALAEAKSLISNYPYSLPLYVLLAQRYAVLRYPDLAAGSAYKALLLSDAIQDEGDEYNAQAIDAVTTQLPLYARYLRELGLLHGHAETQSERPVLEATQTVLDRYLPVAYQILSTSLLACDCFQSAYNYCQQGCTMYAQDVRLQRTRHDILKAAGTWSSEHDGSSDWPDYGFVRREQYPWNDYEPNRLDEVSKLNAMMHEVAPKLEVLVVDLPILTGSHANGDRAVVKQLGVFAKEGICPGEIVLSETSMLTANNKLQDALCDACSADLPELRSSEAENTVSCPDCEVVFCSQRCCDKAMASYHPALCDMDVESIAKDFAPAQAAASLYSLLLLRALALAETQQCHPLELDEVKYIWGDFHSESAEKHWGLATKNDAESSGLPKTLPFSFENNIRLPFHMLEKMDIDIFANPQYDVWVFNTLYAKFRGTASARLSGLAGRPIRGPEVSAVHPMWCLANHSCDPNVSWDWSGDIQFRVREQRVDWEREGQKVKGTEAGIKKGQEILNHYCDITLPVKERREWAQGALGGDCRCSRCVWEAGEDE